MSGCENLATKSDVQALSNKIDSLNQRLAAIEKLLEEIRGYVFFLVDFSKKIESWIVAEIAGIKALIEGLRDVLLEAIESTKEGIIASINALKTILLAAMEATKEGIISVVNALKDVLIELIKSIFGDNVDIDYEKIAQIVIDALQSVRSDIQSLATLVSGAKKEILEAIYNATNRILGQLSELNVTLQGIYFAVVTTIPELLSGILGAITYGFSALTAVVTAGFTAIEATLATIISAIAALGIKSLLDAIFDVIYKTNAILSLLDRIFAKEYVDYELIRSIVYSEVSVAIATTRSVAKDILNYLEYINISLSTYFSNLEQKVISRLIIIEDMIRALKFEIDYSRIQTIVNTGVSPYFDNLQIYLINNFSYLKDLILRIKIEEIDYNRIQTIVNTVVSPYFDNLQTYLTNNFSYLKDLILRLEANITSQFELLQTFLVNNFSYLKDLILRIKSNVIDYDRIKGIVESALNPIKSTLETIYKEITQSLGGTFTYDKNCNKDTKQAAYVGKGLVGLKSLILSVSNQLNDSFQALCSNTSGGGGENDETKTEWVYLFPGEHFTEQGITSQLILTFGTEYPKQTGSNWHLQVPSPIEYASLSWETNFEPLTRTMGEIYGRIYFENFNTPVACYGSTEESVRDFLLSKIAPLSSLPVAKKADGTERIRISKGGAKNPPKTREIRCVKAVWVKIDPNTKAVIETQCFVPPDAN